VGASVATCGVIGGGRSEGGGKDRECGRCSLGLRAEGKGESEEVKGQVKKGERAEGRAVRGRWKI